MSQKKRLTSDRGGGSVLIVTTTQRETREIMKLENLKDLPYQPAGGTRQFGNWSVSDFDIVPALNDGATFTRRFSYYGTPMLDLRWNCGAWEIGETYIGWGSASEQKGVNRILSGAGLTSVKYRRNGGVARYEAVA